MKKQTKTWRCTRCGTEFEHEGNEAPDKCSEESCDCKKFEEVTPLVKSEKLTKLLLWLLGAILLLVILFTVLMVYKSWIKTKSTVPVKTEATMEKEIQDSTSIKTEEVKTPAVIETSEITEEEIQDSTSIKTEEVKTSVVIETPKVTEEVKTPVVIETPKKEVSKVTKKETPKVGLPKKTTDKWPIIKTFSIGSRNLVVRLRKVNYKWKKMNVDPFLKANKEWTMKKRIYLMVEKEGLKIQIADGLWQQVKLAMDTNEAQGVTTREVKKGETFLAMFSGGMNGNTIRLDIGKITIDIEYYYKYHYDDKGNFVRREKIKMNKNDHINGKSYVFPYENEIFELVWYEGSLGGISQCGNLALRNFPATK